MKPWLQHIGRFFLVLVLVAGLAYCGGGDSGTSPPPPDNDPPPDPQVVGPAGGSVSLLNGAVQITVPAGALSGDVRLTAEATSSFPASELVLSGSTIELGPTGTTFATPVTLTLSYDPSGLPAGVNESELRLRKVIGGEWEDFGDSSPNTGANTVTASLSSFSVYGVLAIEVDDVDVSPDEATIAVGGTQQFTAAVMGDGVTLPNRAVTWSTVDPAVATVDDTGLVTAVAEGTTEVRATHTADGEEIVGSADIMVAIPVTSVPVTPAAPTINAGETVQLTGQTLGPDDQDLMRTITWSSSDDAVATVDNTGLVSGLSGGTATITAMSEGVSGTATVTVNDPVTQVTVDPTTATVEVGETAQITAMPAGATGNDLSGTGLTETWATDDAAVATVDDTGLVTAVAPGTANITVTIGGIMATATITVPTFVASLPVTPAESTINAGETAQLTGQTLGPGGEDLMRTIEWSSSDEAIATVDETGLVTGVSAGTVTITGTAGAASGTAMVTVNDPVATVTVDPTSASLTTGETVQITATPTGATGNDLSETGLTETWATDAAAVATVDNTGLVTAVGPGTANITVTIDGVMATATITVTVTAAELVGSWVGTWTNTTSGSSGPAAWTISIDEGTNTITLTTDLDGNVFGISNPLPEQYTTDIGTEMTVFNEMSATFGDLTLTINNDGTMTATGTNVPAAGIDMITWTGTVTPTQINLDYIVTFTGGGTAVGTLQVTKDATNQVPMAVALPTPGSIPTGDNNTTVVTIDGSLSSDGDGDPLTFEWDVGAGTLVNGTTNTDQAVQLTFPGTVASTVTLTVNDGRGGLARVQATVTVMSAENQAPTAAVTADPTSVPAGDDNQTVVTIDASGSSDPDGDALTFSWIVPSGTFVGGTTNTDEIIQVTFPGAAPYTVTVTVDDGRGGTDSASITITLGG